MYIPPHFDEPSVEKLHELIIQNPLGILFTNGSSGYDANHIPFEIAPTQGQHGALHAHVSRNNPIWKDVQSNDEVLVVFRGADAYISPNWYPSKQDHHKQVPTWNYMVAHVHGRIVIRDDEKYVRGLVGRLTRAHESSQPVPWKMKDAPKDYMDTMIRNIVGIEIHITRLVGKSKLNQNKELRDISGVAQALTNQGDTELGREMLSILSRSAVEAPSSS